MTIKMYTIENINKFIIKILSETNKEDEIFNALVSFGSFITAIPDEEYQKIGVSPNLVKEKLSDIIKSIKDVIVNFNRGLIIDAYSSLYKLLFAEDNNNLSSI